MVDLVLTNIPIYLFSFYKDPKAIIKEIMMSQCVFHQGGLKEKKKLIWISWSKICMSKEEEASSQEFWKI